MIVTGMLCVLLMLTFTGCGGAIVDGADEDRTLDPAVQFRGPHALSPRDLEAASPHPVVPEAVSESSFKAARSPDDVVDLSGFEIVIAKASNAEKDDGEFGVSARGLSGPVSSNLVRFVGHVGMGQRVTYTFSDAITVAFLHTSAGDADLYAYGVVGCDGRLLGSSTRGGGDPDYIDVLTRGGATTCRQLVVVGYRASNYELIVYRYR